MGGPRGQAWPESGKAVRAEAREPGLHPQVMKAPKTFKYKSA